MRLPDLDRWFFLVLGVVWVAFLVPAYLHVAESTSITTAAFREARLVKATIKAERPVRGFNTRKFDVSFPRTFGLSSCYLLTSNEEAKSWTSAEISIYVIPDTPAQCATPRTLAGAAPRTPLEDVLATSALSLVAALMLTAGIWRFVVRRWVRRRGSVGRVRVGQQPW